MRRKEKVICAPHPPGGQGYQALPVVIIIIMLAMKLLI
jgi:hypothetical protein